MLDAKVEILRLLEEGEAITISQAARMLGLKPANVYRWGHNDKDFQEAIASVNQTVADGIEAEFVQSQENVKNMIAKMMLLKGHRPMYREAYKIEASTDKLEKMLEDLRKLREVTSKEG